MSEKKHLTESDLRTMERYILGASETHDKNVLIAEVRYLRAAMHRASDLMPFARKEAQVLNDALNGTWEEQ